MTWTYSGDPAASDLDKYRFILGDTDEHEPIMQNEEIQFIIDTYSYNENKLLYQLFSSAATTFARNVKIRLGPQSIDPTTRMQYFKERVENYRKKLIATGLSVPTYHYDKTFKRGMMNNPPWR